MLTTPRRKNVRNIHRESLGPGLILWYDLSKRVFEKRVLRIFGPIRDEVTGKWRKLHNVELNELYSSSNIVRIMK
jgi:hypothetical protein